ncbi:hypothetical protein AB0H07_43135 [Streptomyces sp. NPDC021354]|uniref:hypothetical protein n=1 Tax=Streptomyces sp. NPDC021354 TaxID=3154793 RepID=UPI0033D90580
MVNRCSTLTPLVPSSRTTDVLKVARERGGRLRAMGGPVLVIELPEAPAALK